MRIRIMDRASGRIERILFADWTFYGGTSDGPPWTHSRRFFGSKFFCNNTFFWGVFRLRWRNSAFRRVVVLDEIRHEEINKKGLFLHTCCARFPSDSFDGLVSEPSAEASFESSIKPWMRLLLTGRMVFAKTGRQGYSGVQEAKKIQLLASLLRCSSSNQDCILILSEKPRRKREGGGKERCTEIDGEGPIGVRQQA